MNGLKGFGDGNGAEVVMSMNKLAQMVGANQPTINMTVNGATGQDVNQLAEIVTQKLILQMNRGSNVW